MNYIVQRGDTFFSIARIFNTNVDKLLDINPQIIDPDMIIAGEIINLPPAERCPTLREGNQGPQVRRLQRLLRAAGYDPGPTDGIFGPRTRAAVLAFQRDVTRLEATGVANRETWIALGTNCAPISAVRRYVIRRNDSLFNIANRFNVSVDSIININPQISDPDLIYPGQIIRIPTDI